MYTTISFNFKTKEKINNFVLEGFIKLGYPYDEEYLEGIAYGKL
jgi:hypothetical protein